MDFCKLASQPAGSKLDNMFDISPAVLLSGEIDLMISGKRILVAA